MRRLVIIIILLSFFLTISCSKKINKIVVILVDLSESTNKPQMRELYSESFKECLNKITHGDSLFVAPITEASYMEVNFIIKEKNIVPKNELKIQFMNIFEARKKRRELMEKLERKVENLQKIFDNTITGQKRKILKTDILTSLNMVDERIFRAYKNKKNIKMLVIMSDMIEDSDFYNFEKENLSEERIEEIINQRKNQKLIPDLTGVKVYIVGAHAPSVSKFLQIKKFWMRYLQESGAILSEENYSSSCPLNICE